MEDNRKSVPRFIVKKKGEKGRREGKKSDRKRGRRDCCADSSIPFDLGNRKTKSGSKIHKKKKKRGRSSRMKDRKLHRLRMVFFFFFFYSDCYAAYFKIEN